MIYIGGIDQLVLIENQIIYWYLIFVFLCGIFVGFLNILAPNWLGKRYISGKAKLPKDNSTRFIGIIFLGLSVYAFSWLLGFVE